MHYVLLIFLLMWSPFAFAITTQDSPSYIPKMPPLPKAKGDAVAWELFMQTKEEKKKATFPDGSYSFTVTPIFPDKLQELNDKDITIHGFMFPLEQSEKQANFLIGPFPPSCPFHYHIPPSLIVEVKAKKPIAFSWDEITIKGTLNLSGKDSNGIFYYLNNAEVLK